jgi:hypothetical protein
MSGKKDVPVRLTREQRDRMINATRAINETAQQLMEREELRQAAQDLSNSCISLITDLLQRQVNGLSDDIRVMAAEQNRRLTRMANNYSRSSKEIQEQREKDRAEFETSLSALENSIAAKERTHKEQAEFWISQTEVFFDDIEQYRHDLFTPGQLDRLREFLGQVAQDMKLEAYQSAITSARNVFNQAAELKERVVNAEIEWANYHQQFQQAFADLRSNLYYHQTMQFIIETDAGTETIDANIDYWTEGALSAIVEAVSNIGSVSANINNLSTAELIRLLNSVQTLNTQLNDACQRAKDGLICSQMRAEIASDLADQLQQSGWEFVGYTYEGQEMNAPLHVKLRDMAGNEIVAIISPQLLQNTLGSNMEINFFDPYNNDESLRGIWVDGIIESLRRSGLDVGSPVTRPGYEVKQSDNEAIRNLEETARRKEQ